MFFVHKDEHIADPLPVCSFLQFSDKFFIGMLPLKWPAPIFNMFNPQFFFYHCWIVEVFEFPASEQTVKSILLNPDLKAIRIIFILSPKIQSQGKPD